MPKHCGKHHLLSYLGHKELEFYCIDLCYWLCYLVATTAHHYLLSKVKSKTMKKQVLTAKATILFNRCDYSILK